MSIINEEIKAKDNAQRALVEKWSSDGDKFNLAELKKNRSALVTTAQLLENQYKQIHEDLNVTGQVANYTPVVMKMIRRITPNLLALQIAGTQAMQLPTGLAFAIKAKYPTTTAPINYLGDTEALFNKVDTAHSGTGTSDYTVNPFDDIDLNPVTGHYMDTATGETAPWKSMGIEIVKVALEAKTRQLRADYSLEIEKDLRAVHGLDAQTELSNILTDEIMLETDQELLRTIYSSSHIGAQDQATAGTYDYLGGDGRWQGERALAMWSYIEREANRLALLNRRGRANFIITSSDVATMLMFAQILKNDTNYHGNMDVDVITNSYVGMAGRFKVFVDPFLEHNGVVLGYKGNNEYDAGIFYAPYVPLQMVSGTDVINGFKPAIGFHTRAAIAANPFTSLDKGKNVYFTKFKIANL